MVVVNKKIILRGVLLVLIAATLIFIWSNSLATAEESSDISGTVVEKVKPIIDPHNKIDDGKFVWFIRKAAHFSEFALLGAELNLLVATFDKFKKITVSSFLLSILPTFSCSVIDELLQLTSLGRACRFTDMLIDLCGIVTGVLFILLMRFFIIKLHNPAK